MARPTETLTVKRESLPVRCEVCHQADKFNRATGVCRRCNEAFDEPVGLMPWFALGHWNVPETFHEEFLEAAGREPVLWVGRPVRRLAARKINYFELAVSLALMIGCCLSVRFFIEASTFFIIWVVGFLVSISLSISLFMNHRRIDRTLYVLTERRALVLFANRSAPTKEYAVKHGALLRKMVDKRADVGHLIFAELDNAPFGESSPDAWDEPVRMTLLKNLYPRGFFFIENVTDVERIVHDQIPRQEVIEPIPFYE